MLWPRHGYQVNPRTLSVAGVLTFFVSIAFSVHEVHGQGDLISDTASVLVSTGSAIDSVRQDSLERHTELSPLDIGRNRGLFILSSDKLMQMRILGSVRALFSFNDNRLNDQNALNPFEIPTGDVFESTNFYAGLSQTRLGFEVTRRTKNFGDLFLRIEADFANDDNGFRIRHAYGQMKNFLIGQTWSLFSNVRYLPATVDLNGPVGSIGLRTPQVRYFRTINREFSWYLGLEYSSPKINSPDSINAEFVQVIPDFTGRLDYVNDKLAFQLNMLLITLSGRDENAVDSEVKSKIGFGASLSLKIKTDSLGTVYFSAISGRAIEHYIDMFAGKSMDVVFNPAERVFNQLPVHSGYIAYGRRLPATFSTNIGFGIAAVSNFDFQSDDEFNYGYNFLFNVFWQPVDGARLGIEYNHGRRVDVGGAKGTANRVSFLIYYDF